MSMNTISSRNDANLDLSEHFEAKVRSKKILLLTNMNSMEHQCKLYTLLYCLSDTALFEVSLDAKLPPNESLTIQIDKPVIDSLVLVDRNES